MKKWFIAGIGNARFMTVKGIILNSRGTYQFAHATGSQRKEISAMDYDNDNIDKTVTISRSVYDSYHASDIVALLLNVYLDKIRAGEMELDFKVVDLINEAGL